MSADDAIFIQQDSSGAWVAQYGKISADFPPDPEVVELENRFNTIEDAILANIENAHNTEYGFEFPNLKGNGYGPTRRENEGNTLTLFSLDEASFLDEFDVEGVKQRTGL